MTIEKNFKIILIGLSAPVVVTIGIWLYVNFLLPKVSHPFAFDRCIFDSDCIYTYCCGCINKNARCHIMCDPGPGGFGPSYECKCINFKCQKGEPKLESYIESKISFCQFLCERALSPEFSEEQRKRYKDHYCDITYPFINKSVHCWEGPINVECDITCD